MDKFNADLNKVIVIGQKVIFICAFTFGAIMVFKTMFKFM